MSLLTCCLFLLTLLISLTTGRSNAVIISEVADKGSSGVCDGNDWLELYNPSAEPVELTGWQLHDDQGALHAETFTFADGALLESGGFYLLCCGDAGAGSTQFGIGSEDTISLLDNNLAVVSQVGPLLGGTNSGFDISYALDTSNLSNTMTYSYTTAPTPGEPNAIVTPEGIKQRLAEENKLGEKFFNMDLKGDPVPDGMPPVLDFHIDMTKPNMEYLFQNRSFEVYVPFESVTLKEKGQNKSLLTLNSPGRIRSKGQWSLFLSACIDAPSMPMQLDVDYTNKSQTLFGVRRLYLRTHSGDNSNIREWSAHRMLARFGVPYVRARHVNVFVNDIKVGFYTLMEAPDQDYVFARSFPGYDPSNYALFKVKSLAIPSLGCGSYQEAELQMAREAAGGGSPSAYTFDRGEHRVPFPVLGVEGLEECFASFIGWIGLGRADATLAYVREGEPDCGSFYVDSGFIDRDLGKKEWEPSMKDFVNDHWSCASEEEGCINTELMSSQVDVDNFLKSFAFYATTLFIDSPIGNQNNYYIAGTGDGQGWRIVSYDHNSAGDNGACNFAHCPEKLIYWSIIRPTCGSLESNALVGPLLSDPILHEQYLEYVGSFVDTVTGNASFLGVLQKQIEAIKDDAEQDYWTPPGVFEKFEMSQEPADWEQEGLPWIPFLKARAEQIRLQLKALDDGSFPRGPHLEIPVEPEEQCADWRSTEPVITGCYQNCLYEGCYQEGWLVPGFCDLMTNQCVHAEVDPGCEDIADGARYDGMENRGDMETTCFSIAGQPAMVSTCPPPPNDAVGEDTLQSNALSSQRSGHRVIAASTLLLLPLLSITSFW